MDELDENIDKMITYIFNNVKLNLQPMNYPKMCVTQEFLEKFKNLFTEPLPMHITTFEKIGVHDPFPDEPNEDIFKVPESN